MDINVFPIQSMKRKIGKVCMHAYVCGGKREILGFINGHQLHHYMNV